MLGRTGPVHEFHCKRQVKLQHVTTYGTDCSSHFTHASGLNSRFPHFVECILNAATNTSRCNQRPSVQNSSFTRSDRSHDENPLERAGWWAAPGLKNSTEFTLTFPFAPCVLTSVSGSTSTSVSSSPLSNVNTLVVSKLGGAFERETKPLPEQYQNKHQGEGN